MAVISENISVSFSRHTTYFVIYTTLVGTRARELILAFGFVVFELSLQ